VECVKCVAFAGKKYVCKGGNTQTCHDGCVIIDGIIVDEMVVEYY
jgi:hypothetical protein